MDKTEKISAKIYNYIFKKQGAAPKIKDGLKAVEDVVSKLGMSSKHEDYFMWIEENIKKHG